MQSAYITEMVFRIQRPWVTNNGLKSGRKPENHRIMKRDKSMRDYNVQVKNRRKQILKKGSSANFILQRPQNISIIQSFPRCM